MAQARAPLQRVPAVERRPPVAATTQRIAAAAAPLSPGRALQQRLGNAGTHAFLTGAAQFSSSITVGDAVTAPASARAPSALESAAPTAAIPSPDNQPPPPSPAPTAEASGAPKERARGEAEPPAKTTPAPAEAAGDARKAPPAEAAAAAEAEKPAAPPSPREAVAPAIAAVRHRAAGARKHSKSPETLVASAQAAAKVPGTEQRRAAAEQTAINLDADPEAVKRDAFKQALKAAIAAATPEPKTEAQAEQVMKQGASDASNMLRGELKTESDVAAAPLKSAKQVSPGEVPAEPQATMEPEPMGAAPAAVSPGPVVPAPLPPQRLDYSSDREPADRAMAENNITQEQLKKGKDPAFGPTLEARSTAEKHEAEVEGRYRQSEAMVQAQAHDSAGAVLGKNLAGMHEVRGLHVGKVIAKQIGTQAKDAAERKRVTDTIEGIKNRTREAVEAILKFMELQAGIIFDTGLRAAESAYEDTFEEAKGGVGTWLTTWGEDWEELIRDSLATARREYLRVVDLAIDAVADFVDGQLNLAKRRVTQGREEVQKFVQSLDKSVQAYGIEAQKAVSSDFEAMDGAIDQRRDALIEKLVQQYKASYERMSAMEERLREANKSLWQRVYDATVGLIKKIIAFKDMLVSILVKAANLVVDIISDPIGFLGNLIDGVMQGLRHFMDKIGVHLQKGLMEWLFGALASAGLQLPDKFDLRGILSIVLQILGLTYANFRARAVAIVGEPVVAALEQGAEVFLIFMKEGVGGLWRFIKDQVADLKSMVLDAIFEFVKEKVIVAGITWIIGLLNPASAFFKACKAIYDIVTFFINRGSQIIALVNAIIDSIASIVKGNIAVAANMVENALARAIPVAVGFLASLLGLGDPAKPVRETIEKAKSPVNRAIDWVINQAVKLVKAAGALFRKPAAKEPALAGHARPASATVIDEVRQDLKDRAHNIDSASTFGEMIDTVARTHLGLSAIRVRRVDDGQYVIEASASPFTFVDIVNTLVTTDYGFVVGTVAFDGVLFGDPAYNGPGLHAEDKIIGYVTTRLEYLKKQNKVLPAKVEIYVSQSPCKKKCAPNLIDLKNAYPAVKSWLIYYSYEYAGTSGKHAKDSMEARELLKEAGFHVLQFDKALEMERKGKPAPKA